MEIYNILKNKGLKQTPIRLALVDIFINHNGAAIPMSIIESELGVYDRVTLYRTIKIFKEKGIIHEISISDEDKQFAICKDHCTPLRHVHHHIHFKCSQCKTVSCLNLNAFPKLDVPEYQIDQIEIQATGICKECI